MPKNKGTDWIDERIRRNRRRAARRALLDMLLVVVSLAGLILIAFAIVSGEMSRGMESLTWMISVVLVVRFAYFVRSCYWG